VAPTITVRATDIAGNTQVPITRNRSQVTVTPAEGAALTVWIRGLARS
jgi:hypothetical protein